MRTRIIGCAIALALSGCGDDDDTGVDAAMVDAAPMVDGSATGPDAAPGTDAPATVDATPPADANARDGGAEDAGGVPDAVPPPDATADADAVPPDATPVPDAVPIPDAVPPPPDAVPVPMDAAVFFCPDGRCQAAENCRTCPSDCGTCPDPDQDAGADALCGHTECVSGTPLDSSCGECAAAICAADSFCCSTSWDSLCVGAVPTQCMKTCP